jgi:hypothetical protein
VKKSNLAELKIMKSDILGVGAQSLLQRVQKSGTVYNLFPKDPKESNAYFNSTVRNSISMKLISFSLFYEDRKTNEEEITTMENNESQGIILDDYDCYRKFVQLLNLRIDGGFETKIKNYINNEFAMKLYGEILIA